MSETRQMAGVDPRKHKDLIIMLVALGDAYLEKGLYAEAAKRYNQLLDLNFANKHVYHNLSRALINLRNFGPDALRVYRKAVQLDPHDSQIAGVLAQSFLSEKRSDPEAMQVYELAFQHDQTWSEELAEFLVELHHSEGQPAKCKHVSENWLAKRGLQAKPLEYYLNSCWKLADFQSATNLLKKFIDTTENNTNLLRQLCATYLERRFRQQSAQDKSHFSFFDWQLVNVYLSRISRFNSLRELAFYLELKCLLAENQFWSIPDQQKPVRKLAFSTESPEAREKTPGRQQNETTFDFAADVLNKLHALEDLPARSETLRSSLTFEDFQERGAELFSGSEESGYNFPAGTDIIVTIEFSNFDKIRVSHGPGPAGELRNKIWLLLSEFIEKYHFESLWMTNNGLLILTQDLLQAVTFATDVLNRLNRHNALKEPVEQIHLAFGIHHARTQFNALSDKALHDISAGIKLATVKAADLTDEDRPMYGKVLQNSDRIFLSARAYREIKSANRFKVNALGNFRLRYLNEPLSLYEISWRNPVDELRYGYINRLGRFELLAEIGSHENIKIYKAKDADLQRFVILKIVQSPAFNSLPNDNPQKQEFYRISRIPSQFNHPNIVKIYDVDEDRGLTFMAREFVEGTNLLDLMRKDFDLDRFVKVIYQAFKALHYTHRFGLFHLNLKPNNILIDINDQAKIMDFFVPKSLLLPASNMIDETDAVYFSPEQLQGQTADARSDIFAMGLIMYQALTQTHPFVDPTYPSLLDAVLQKRPAKPSVLHENLPGFFDALIMKCLEKRPEDRFQTSEHIVTLLKKNFERTLFSNFNYQIAQSRDSL